MIHLDRKKVHETLRRKKMKKIIVIFFLISLVGLGILIPVIWTAEKEYTITFEEIEKAKRFFDDPRPVFKDLNYKKILPSEIYSKLTYDVVRMKNVWAECVGFKAPDVVGKIASEIKPGTYSYKDKEKYPGFKEMMPPELYKQFNPGGPPFAGNFPQIKVIPTQQYYWALPISEATKKHMGMTKLDSQGYILYDSYVAGVPFPQPSGPFKAQQIVYNREMNYDGGEGSFSRSWAVGFNKNLKIDSESHGEVFTLRLHGRVISEPYGWLDERARLNKEAEITAVRYLSPRDLFGSAFNTIRYRDSEEFDSNHLYIGMIRRIRKMSATDTQDAMGGQDMAYEDNRGFSQKLSPKRFPYKFEVIDEREMLIPTYTSEGSQYFSSKEKEFHNVEFERRPVYVVKLTQLDNNYVYGKRILYFDKETLLIVFAEFYDQKGRLYRSFLPWYYHNPEMGMFVYTWVTMRDHLDLHSTIAKNYILPVTWISREHVGLSALTKMGK